VAHLSDGDIERIAQRVVAEIARRCTFCPADRSAQSRKEAHPCAEIQKAECLGPTESEADFALSSEREAVALLERLRQKPKQGPSRPRVSDRFFAQPICLLARGFWWERSPSSSFLLCPIGQKQPKRDWEPGHETEQG